MEKLQSFNQIAGVTNAIRSYKEGFITNFYISESRCSLLIERGFLYRINYEKCVFIFYKDHDFYHIYYTATNKETLIVTLEKLIELYPDVAFVVDLIGMEFDIEELSKVYEQVGFDKYVRLFRMNRMKNLDEPQTLDSRVQYATHGLSLQIYELLDNYFDQYSKQVPLIEELNQWIAENRVIVILESDQVLGFVIYEINGVTSYLRYWFVHPEHQNKKIGSGLLRRFFYDCRHTKRQLFWVKEDNENAIIRYKYYGFEPEYMLDQVMIKIK